ncbi:MAG: peptide deformylase [Actinomycetota bacterium]
MQIRTLGDPVLREPSKPVERFDGSLRDLVEEMWETMYAANGVGLAGPQVGLSSQMFTYDDGETGPSFLANPALSLLDGELSSDEGCLSIPGPYYPTARAGRVRIVGADLEGRQVEIEAEGLLARIFQHETDHLLGVLYIDRLDDAGRRAVMTELRQIEMGLVEPRKRRDDGE